MRAVLVMAILVMVVTGSALSAATVIVNCDVGGAQLELYDFTTRSWQKSSFPKVLSLPRYSYVLVRATAPGYETLERGYDVDRADMNNFLVSLVPENPYPESTPLFGISGQIVSRRGLAILPNTYRVVCRNLTTYKKSDGHQVSQDINYNDSGAWFSGVFANFANNRAAAVGDRVFIGVFNSSLTRCFGHEVRTLEEEDISNAGILTTIFIR